MVLEAGIDVALPIELLHQVIQVSVFVLRYVLDEQLPRHRSPLDHRLVHAENVRAPLRLVSHERARRVQDARRHQPAGAGLEPISLTVVQDAVVTFVPAPEAAANVGLGGPRLQAEERIRKVVPRGVQLGWKIIRLWFTLLPH